ncbi:MAG: coproporphyrinogen III oxidase, partial [Chitinophagaceae bacterium]
LCIDDISSAGFENFSVDLIYGSPLLSDDELIKNLEVIVGKKVPHISCYALTVEPKTILDHQIKKRLSQNVSSEKQSRQFLLVMDHLRNAGYEHYEISNFALPGFRSRHNSSYWKGLPYYGFGPSAHSFNGNDVRKWNLNNNALYAKNILNNEPCAVSETLSSSEKWNEFVMISIRTIEGISIERSEREFGRNLTENLLQESRQWISGGKMLNTKNCLVLTDEGKLFADGIAASLFA